MAASFRFVSFRFVSFRFVSFRFVSFRFVSFVSFLFGLLCRGCLSFTRNTPASRRRKGSEHTAAQVSPDAGGARRGRAEGNWHPVSRLAVMMSSREGRGRNGTRERMLACFYARKLVFRDKNRERGWLLARFLSHENYHENFVFVKKKTPVR